ncbi:uncharacterized protein BYT42DRAFT_593522 [Radiomyces spectabilis]|uniref:uncharacterized protein n=1 Tax=Radiomyces spectabilis TaxID=64574 RepID=UPI0022212551|nr:uncharacterized protein BYT42DRAFT_593522 [Radiomyces spectabilis]KAI8379402.1 hypothetical protein BYT42DRAFT_593522 [Radiomyces spectabilis]
MVSCGVHSETRALGQVQNCLEKYVQELFPDCESTWTRFEGDLDVEETDDNKEDTTAVDDKRKEKKFQAVDAACGGLVFYRFRINVKPTEFIDKMMDAMSQLSKPELEELLPRIRHTARWIPLDYICPATTERMAKCFERLREDHFKEVSDDDKRTVAIVTEIRNNISLKKEDIIQTIAPLIPKGLKVDLKKPTDVIFVTVFKSVCGMTVLKDYYEKKKYNIVGLLQEKASAA